MPFSALTSKKNIEIFLFVHDNFKIWFVQTMLENKFKLL